MRFRPSIKNYKGRRKTTLYRQNSQSKNLKKYIRRKEQQQELNQSKANNLISFLLIKRPDVLEIYEKTRFIPVSVGGERNQQSAIPFLFLVFSLSLWFWRWKTDNDESRPSSWVDPLLSLDLYFLDQRFPWSVFWSHTPDVHVPL